VADLHSQRGFPAVNSSGLPSEKVFQDVSSKSGWRDATVQARVLSRLALICSCDLAGRRGQRRLSMCISVLIARLERGVVIMGWSREWVAIVGSEESE
jgi:hypothetical protein